MSANAPIDEAPRVHAASTAALVRERFLAASRRYLLESAAVSAGQLNVQTCGFEGHTPRSIAYGPSKTTQLCRP
jgi:hypothetical protein